MAQKNCESCILTQMSVLYYVSFIAFAKLFSSIEITLKLYIRDASEYQQSLVLEKCVGPIWIALGIEMIEVLLFPCESIWMKESFLCYPSEWRHDFFVMAK